MTTTFSQLWNAIRVTWRSRPFAIILPLAALVWYFFTHTDPASKLPGHHTLPNWQEFVAGAALLTTKWERVTEFFLGPPDAPKPPPVSLLVALLGTCISLGASGCGHTVPPVIVEAGQCVATDLIGDVNNYLVDGNWLAELESLGVRCGLDLVSKVVQQVGSQSRHAAYATSDPLESLKADRASAWLSKHPAPGS